MAPQNDKPALGKKLRACGHFSTNGSGTKELCSNCYTNKWRKEHPAQAKAIDRRKRRKALYGISEEEYLALETAQGSVCALCKRPNYKNIKLAVDHNHATGKIRGLLCTNCNRYLIGTIEHHQIDPMDIVRYLSRDSSTGRAPAL